MTNINDDRDAIPVGGWAPYQPPMTLRDWFAGQALMSMLSTPEKISDSTYDKAAKLAFRFADAMIRARDAAP